MSPYRKSRFRTFRLAQSLAFFAVVLVTATIGDSSWAQVAVPPHAVIATIPVGRGPANVGIDPTTNRVYVVNQFDHSVSVIDGATNAVIATIPVAAYFGIDVNPSTHVVYVATPFSGTVSIIAGSSNTVVASVTLPGVGFLGGGLAVNPVTNRVYVAAATNAGPQIWVIDGNNNTTQTAIPTDGRLLALCDRGRCSDQPRVRN